MANLRAVIAVVTDRGTFETPVHGPMNGTQFQFDVLPTHNLGVVHSMYLELWLDTELVMKRAVDVPKIGPKDTVRISTCIDIR